MGLVAVNDALWIEGTMYKVIRRHFRTEQYYLNIVELFHEVSIVNLECVTYCTHSFIYLHCSFVIIYVSRLSYVMHMMLQIEKSVCSVV